ncbi:hypothetical protein KKH36_03930 [Patescibacteria group bacterium]|nr:hypothetical protein [Patescibacteria group bacterium]
MLFEREAVKFGQFKLKLHEKNPDAPLSPFYFNIRSKDHPKNPGPLTKEDCDLIACIMLSRIEFESQLHFEAMAGLPYAADSIIESIEKMIPDYKEYFRIIKLHKEVSEDKRRIVPLPGFEYRDGENVLLVDDLVTKAHSKLEAIHAVESQGSVVKYLLVLLDRMQGGAEQLREAGYTLISCVTATELFDYYLMAGKINREKWVECMDYIKSN